MIFSGSEMKPIYLQLSEWLETEILSGNITAGEKIYSQYQLAEMFNINPATAAKGLNILADEKILYKKRGLGMFVSPEAGEIILRKRREQVRARLRELVKEADLLDISESELITMITAARKRNKEERA
ncbi:MAG: GntR family transcriptional regulator [Firmicutes bacterium]|jgi:DNA-binding transcriptional regulator YhcF (GntR family)|nr:GntR family transcriptional regulator [Bacillota bacterium]